MAELKSRFIQDFKAACKLPMSIVDLAACVQEEGESTTHWVKRVSAILHSSDRINADTAVLTLEGNCRFTPLKLKLGRLKCHCNDMSTLMAALVKYADLDSTKDPESDDDKIGNRESNGNANPQHHSPAAHGNGGKSKADHSLDFVANTNTQDKG